MQANQQLIVHRLLFDNEIHDRKLRCLRCLLTKMNPTFCKYIFQRRQGQLRGFHFLILALNYEKVSVSFISRGTYSQIFGPKFFQLSRSL